MRNTQRLLSRHNGVRGRIKSRGDSRTAILRASRAYEIVNVRFV